jgi:hypothetical protein
VAAGHGRPGLGDPPLKIAHGVDSELSMLAKSTGADLMEESKSDAKCRTLTEAYGRLGDCGQEPSPSVVRAIH